MNARGAIRIGVLGATLEPGKMGNMGVGALAYGTSRCLSHQFPGAQIFLLDYGHQSLVHNIRVGRRELSVPLVNLRFSKRFYLPNNIALLILLALVLRLVPFRRLRERILAGNRWLEAIAGADLFVSIAGGDSFTDLYGLGRLLYVGLPQLLVLLLGKRLILLPQTVGPFRSALARSFARFILTRAERVYTRDRDGVAKVLALIGSNGRPVRIEFCYDVGFLLEPVAPERIELVGLPLAKRPGILRVGLNISALLYLGGYTRNNMFSLRVDYPSLVRSILQHLLRQDRTELVLIPHVFTTKGDVEGDSWVCEQIYEQLHPRYPGRLGVVRGRYSPGEIKFVIGQCDLFLGSRMHACIAAVSQQIPTVAIAYSDKFVGVMQSVSMDALVVDLRRMDTQEILARIENIERQLAQVRRQLERTVPPIQQKVLNLLSDFRISESAGMPFREGGQNDIREVSTSS